MSFSCKRAWKDPGPDVGWVFNQHQIWSDVSLPRSSRCIDFEPSIILSTYFLMPHPYLLSLSLSHTCTRTHSLIALFRNQNYAAASAQDSVRVCVCVWACICGWVLVSVSERERNLQVRQYKRKIKIVELKTWPKSKTFMDFELHLLGEKFIMRNLK